MLKPFTLEFVKLATTKSFTGVQLKLGWAKEVTVNRDRSWFSIAATSMILKLRPVAENGGDQLESACALCGRARLFAAVQVLRRLFP